MGGTSNAVVRRLRDSRFITRYFVGNGIDIGAGRDLLILYQELFPKMGSVKAWDLADGDAQYLKGIPDESYDFVHTSHCLEHMVDPQVALQNWLRILKPGGHLICLIPDEDLYEQGVWPSTFNSDHKWTFTIHKGDRSWSTKSVNLIECFTELPENISVVKIELLDDTYRYQLPKFDQTLTPIGECAIEFILRKQPEAEVKRGGRIPPEDKQLTKIGFELLTGRTLP